MRAAGSLSSGQAVKRSCQPTLSQAQMLQGVQGRYGPHPSPPESWAWLWVHYSVPSSHAPLLRRV